MNWKDRKRVASCRGVAEHDAAEGDQDARGISELMHKAALRADEDPDRLSFLQSVRVVQRRMARFAVIPLRRDKPFMKQC